MLIIITAIPATVPSPPALILNNIAAAAVIKAVTGPKNIEATLIRIDRVSKTMPGYN
jgi:hypothetical protein